MNKKPTSLEEAHGLIQEAMKDVIQELIISFNKSTIWSFVNLS